MQPIDPARSCLHCGAPFGAMVCTECVGAKTDLDRCLAAAVFDGPVGRIVRAYKDGGERRLAAEIARIMLGAAVRAQREAPGDMEGCSSARTRWVFVPATASAFRRRGFDHMELIARHLSGRSDIPLLDALVKHGSSDQRELGRADRLAEALGAYEVVLSVRGKRILLIDDVITTGATMSAAASHSRPRAPRTSTASRSPAYGVEAMGCGGIAIPFPKGWLSLCDGTADCARTRAQSARYLRYNAPKFLPGCGCGCARAIGSSRSSVQDRRGRRDPRKPSRAREGDHGAS